MAIAPNSTLKVLKGVPFNNTYRDTTKFASESAQITYFNSKIKYTFPQVTYIRQDSKIRIQRKADDLYDCNYIMFQNTNYGNKWFYGFITNVEYVNDVTSEISYELDVYQTWQFDVTVKECFVEREHSLTDNVGDNLVPENLEQGDYIAENSEGTGHMGNLKIVVASTFNKAFETVFGRMYGNIYSGLTFNIFDTASEVNEFIARAVADNKGDGIVSIFMSPNDFLSDDIIIPDIKRYSIAKAKKMDSYDGYTPRNKKLFTYPYNFLYVTNMSGNCATYKYEHFSTEDCQFTLAGDMSCNPQMTLFPNYYKGLTNNHDERINLDGFPQCAYTTDMYSAWLAQNGSTQSISMLGTAMSTVANVKMGNIGGAVSGAMDIATTVAQRDAIQNQPPQAHGTVASSVTVGLGIKDFIFIRKYIRSEFARIIDDYFDKYGYATHRVKVPNINTRPAYNYVKTINSSVTGDIPVQDLSKICSILDNGVTFWKNPANVGNYSVSNTV